jgi:hypothetical protein
MSNKTIINTTNASGLSNITTLTVPSSSTDCEIVIWDRTSGNSIAGGHGVTISADGDIENVNSVAFDNAAANPGGTNTIWVNTADGHLMHGATDLEDFTVGPGSSTDNAIVRWDGTTGTTIQNSTVLLSDTNRFTVSGQTLLYADPGQNTFITGRTVLATMSGFNNTLVGVDAGTSMSSTAGSNNTAFGCESLKNLGAGSTNIAIGSSARFAYVGTESTNICIRHAGVASDSAAIRLGQSQTTCHIKGIYGVSPGSTTETVIVKSDGQLGSVSGMPATASEYTATLNTSSLIGFTVDMRAYKVGKIVCVTLSATMFALGGPEPLISFSGALPAGYCPTAEVIFPALFMSGGVWDTGLVGNIKVSAASSIVLERDNDAAPSDFDGNSGFDSDITFTFLAA